MLAGTPISTNLENYMNTHNFKRNHKIQAKTVRVLDADGTQLGILPIKDAIQLALSKKVDLIEIAPHANPPVCKLEEWGRFQYNQNKHKHHKEPPLKELTIHTTTSHHDLETKAKQAAKFFSKGHKVKLILQFRGARELSHKEIGIEKIKEFETLLKQQQANFKHDSEVKCSGKNNSGNKLMVTYSPLKRHGEDQHHPQPPQPPQP